MWNRDHQWTVLGKSCEDMHKQFRKFRKNSESCGECNIHITVPNLLLCGCLRSTVNVIATCVGRKNSNDLFTTLESADRQREQETDIFNIYCIFYYKSWREPKTMLLARDANMRRVTKYCDIIAVLASSPLADKWMRFTNHLKYWQCGQQQDKGLKGCISMFRLSQLHIFWND